MIELRVDEGGRKGERRDERSGGVFQVEYDGQVVGRGDIVDHRIVGLAGARYSLRRRDDPLEAGEDVLRGQVRAVVKLDAFLELEGVPRAFVGRLGHFDAQIADDVRRRRRVLDRKSVV